MPTTYKETSHQRHPPAAAGNDSALHCHVPHYIQASRTRLKKLFNTRSTPLILPDNMVNFLTHWQRLSLFFWGGTRLPHTCSHACLPYLRITQCGLQ